MDWLMKELIVKRLKEIRETALGSIALAASKTRAEAITRGALGNSRVYFSIDQNYKDGVAKYIDQSGKFIHQAAGSSFSEHETELRNAANELVRDLMDAMEREHHHQRSRDARIQSGAFAGH